MLETLKCFYWLKLHVFQVNQASIRVAALNLYREEGLMTFFTKGLRPRVIQNILFSFLATLVYDSVKQFSLKDEYKSKVTWWQKSCCSTI